MGLLRDAEEAATAALVAPTRAAGCRSGACRGLASQPGCKVGSCARSPTGQKTASLGSRLEPLQEVSEPQVGAVTVGYVAAPVPLLVVASLVDATTTKYLLKCALRKRQEQEELMMRAQRVIDDAPSLSSSSVKRRKKKRRRESSRSLGADSFLLVVDVPVIMPQIQFIHRRLFFLL